MSKISLKKGETVYATLHQSALVYTKQWIFILIVYVATSYFLFWLLERGITGQIIIGLGYTIATYTFIRTIIFLRGNKFIVTNSRVIDIYKPKLFSRVVTQIKMAEIVDVSGETHGICDTLARLGSLVVEGDDVRVVCKHARGVHVLQDAILELKQKHKKKEIEEEQSTITPKQILNKMSHMRIDTLSTLIEEAMKILKEKKDK